MCWTESLFSTSDNITMHACVAIYVHRIYVFVLEHTGGHNQQEKDDDRLELTWRLHYLVSIGIYARFRNLQKMYFFLQMTMLHSCENRGHGTLFIYTQGNQHAMHFCSTGYWVVYVYLQPAILYWWWSFSLNLERSMKLIKITYSFLLRAKSSGADNLWTKLKMV